MDDEEEEELTETSPSTCSYNSPSESAGGSDSMKELSDNEY